MPKSYSVPGGSIIDAFKGPLKITGVKEIDKALSQLEPKVVKKILRKAMRPAMKPMLKEARANAPVESGQTQRAIRLSAAARSRRSIGLDISIGEKNYVGDQYYGAFIEFGTSLMEARPFMRPAYDAGKDKAKKDTIDGIRELILKQAKKGAK
jgi:HK97 gp10 family phage protein